MKINISQTTHLRKHTHKHSHICKHAITHACTHARTHIHTRRNCAEFPICIECENIYLSLSISFKSYGYTYIIRSEYIHIRVYISTYTYTEKYYPLYMQTYTSVLLHVYIHTSICLLARMEHSFYIHTQKSPFLFCAKYTKNIYI